MSARDNAFSGPSFGQSIGVGLVLSLSGAALLAVLGAFLGAGGALRAVIAMLGLAYVLYLVGKSGERVGRVTTIACWVVAAFAAWLAGLPLVAYVLVHVGPRVARALSLLLLRRSAGARGLGSQRARRGVRRLGRAALGQRVARVLVFLPRASVLRADPGVALGTRRRARERSRRRFQPRASRGGSGRTPPLDRALSAIVQPSSTTELLHENQHSRRGSRARDRRHGVDLSHDSRPRDVGRDEHAHDQSRAADRHEARRSRVRARHDRQHGRLDRTRPRRRSGRSRARSRRRSRRRRSRWASSPIATAATRTSRKSWVSTRTSTRCTRSSWTSRRTAAATAPRP